LTTFVTFFYIEGASKLWQQILWNKFHIPTRGNIFLPVRLLVWADGQGTAARADSAATRFLPGVMKIFDNFLTTFDILLTTFSDNFSHFFYFYFYSYHSLS
jgi:hypothetical protein